MRPGGALAAGRSDRLPSSACAQSRPLKARIHSPQSCPPFASRRKIVEENATKDWPRVVVGDFSPENFHMFTDPLMQDRACICARVLALLLPHLPSTSVYPPSPASRAALLTSPFLGFAHLAAEWEPWKYNGKLKPGPGSEGRLRAWMEWTRKNRFLRRGSAGDVVGRGGVWGQGPENLPANSAWGGPRRYLNPRGGAGEVIPEGGGEGGEGAGAAVGDRDVDGPVWPVFARHVRRKVPMSEFMRMRQPGAPLIVSLRSPPERTASHYFMLCNARCTNSMRDAKDPAALNATWKLCVGGSGPPLRRPPFVLHLSLCLSMRSMCLPLGAVCCGPVDRHRLVVSPATICCPFSGDPRPQRTSPAACAQRMAGPSTGPWSSLCRTSRRAGPESRAYTQQPFAEQA